MSSSLRIIRPVFLLPLILLMAHLAVAQDEPDLKREKKFFDIYNNFNSEPTSEESWSGAISGKAQSYTVQKGDTLWGVSETLFGDPQFWPKIWSLNNEDIENPHEIVPGQEVKFMAGTMGEAPSVSVNENGEQGAPQQASGEEGKPEAPKAGGAAKAAVPDVELPEPKKYSALSGLPQSIPKWDFIKGRGEAIFETTKVSRDFGTPDEFLTYYIQEGLTDAVGTVRETEMGLSSAAQFQYIFVHLPNEAPEKKLLVVKDMDEISDPVSGKEGMIVQVQGQIEILDSVNADEKLFRAIVRQAVGPIEVGAKIIAGPLPTFNSRDEGAGGSVAAQIIGGQFGLSRRIFGFNSLVYLGGEGFTLGHSYPIYKKQELRIAKSEGIEGRRQIGRVKIVKLAQNFATGVITDSTEDIYVGDGTEPVK